jgi:hypothetical protein
MIIDCHGHYTTAPRALEEFRQRQIAALKDPAKAPSTRAPAISDDEIRVSLEGAQLRMQRERGTDLTIFSPRAGGMGHHIGNEATSRHWSEICNDPRKAVGHRDHRVHRGKSRTQVLSLPHQSGAWGALIQALESLCVFCVLRG